MKTLREYIDLIKEAQNPDWKAVIANEVTARGLPKRVCTYTNTSYGWAWSQLPKNFNYKFQGNRLESIELNVNGNNVLVASPDPENDGELPSPLNIYDFGGDGEPSYTDAEEVLSCVESFCAGGYPDEVYVDYENGREEYEYTFEFRDSETIDVNSPEYDSVVSELAKYIGTSHGDDTGWDPSTISNFLRGSIHDSTDYYDVGNHNGCEVQWPGLTIKIVGPQPKIASVNGTLTPAAAPKAPAPKTPSKPVAPKPAQQPPEDDQNI